MNLSSLPTDNLYKFCALTGTVICIITVYFNYQVRQEYEQKFAEIDLAIGLLAVEIEWTDDEATRLQSLIDNSIAKKNGTFEDRADILYLEYSDSEIKEAIRQTSLNLKSAKEGLVKIEHSRAERDSLAKKRDYMSRMGSSRLAFGFFLGLFGFFMWDKKIQKSIDATYLKQQKESEEWLKNSTKN